MAQKYETKPAHAKGQRKVQQELPFAVVDGKPLIDIPQNLYIPPNALEIILDAFEGPLDLLIYLIRRQNLDILDIQVAEITRQYMEYIELMEDLQFELSAEYLVMAAMLAEIKSRMLLPRQDDIEEEEDPRAELIRRLQEYERFKNAALDLDEQPRMNRDFWIASADASVPYKPKPVPTIQLREMLVELARVLNRASNSTTHQISFEPLSTRERMSQILELTSRADDQFVPFSSLFDLQEGRAGVVVTFIAVMELMRASLLDIVQTELFSPIHVKSHEAPSIEAR
ncbi:MAG: ScpA family protein [Gammaproteobacteria bacterium]|nr:ScpA family protein [Gammaproteobacteria bacterium]